MADTLAGLRAELQRRAQRIKKAAQLLKVEVGPINADKAGAFFTVNVWWTGGNTKFNLTEALTKHKPCWIVRQIIQDVLTQRKI